MNPKVSIIMPVYNAEKYIEKTINCMLKQTYKNFELILIVDCPTDGTLQTVSEIKDERIHIIRNSYNKGISYSRNCGLKEAKGEYIALMDHDDLAPKDRIEVEVKYLDEHPEIDVVGGGYAKIDSSDKVISCGRTVPLNNPLYIKAQLLFYCPMANGSAMFRKKIVEKYKIKYQDGLLGMEDYRFWVECSAYGKMTNLNQILLYWRQSNSTESWRVRTNMIEDRKKKFAEIQRYALKLNGFTLDDDEYYIFNKSFEEFNTQEYTREDIEAAFGVVKKIIFQANNRNLENAKEIKIACKKRMTRMIENAKIWNKL